MRQVAGSGTWRRSRPGGCPGVAAPGFDPAVTTLAERERAKVSELRAAGDIALLRSLQRTRGSYRSQGLWGLLDQRALQARSPFRRADAQLLAAMAAAIEAETNETTGTRNRLWQREGAWTPSTARPWSRRCRSEVQPACHGALARPAHLRRGHEPAIAGNRVRADVRPDCALRPEEIDSTASR
jgi:muconolactone delta-isomerase